MKPLLNPDDRNKRLVCLDQVDSTNSYALDLVRQGKADQGMVVTASYQLKGQGQRGKTWDSEPGSNALFTIVYFPDCKVEEQFIKNQGVAVGLARAIRRIMDRGGVNIKWPNDIYIDRKKVAGILIQNVLSGKKIDHMVIGIGINVNQTLFDQALPNPVSLRQVTGESYDVDDIIMQVVRAIDETFFSEDPAAIHREYLEQLYLRGVLSSFKSEGESFKGAIQGISSSGELLISTVNGMRSFSFGDLEYE